VGLGEAGHRQRLYRQAACASARFTTQAFETCLVKRAVMPVLRDAG
jgi:hypothetical protein